MANDEASGMNERLYIKGLVPANHREEAIRRMLQLPGGVLMVCIIEKEPDNE